MSVIDVPCPHDADPHAAAAAAGDRMLAPKAAARDLVTVLQAHAKERPQQVAVRFLADGETDAHDLTYAALDAGARHLAAALRRHGEPGDRVLLMLPTGLDYVVSFFACQYAGMIAVPAYPPEAQHSAHVDRLRRMADDCAARIAVLDDASRALLADSALGAALGDAALVSPSAADGSAGFCIERGDPDALAFLQYTSGSTSAPKGVMVSHANLCANVDAISLGMACRPGDRMFSWLPLYHDMGLIGSLLMPIVRGLHVTLISPLHFLERPSRWLMGIARERASLSGGPDFAYRLCAERVRDAQLDGLDLSSLRIAFCGSEPIRQATLDGFAERFASHGFRPQALYPCYGLAEATLFVTGVAVGAGAPETRFSVAALARASAEPMAAQAVPGDDGAKAVVGCGTAPFAHAVAIVDPQSRAWLPDGRVGEIWCSGPSIAGGYWRNPAATADVFVDDVPGFPGRWLRTGDLGFVGAGGLFVCGRHKDLIVLRGENVYPQDLETELAERVEWLRRGRIAAFPAETADGAEALGIAAEVPRGKARRVAPDAIAAEIASVIGEAFHHEVELILLLEPGDLPRTSSGKLQRSACVGAWRGGTFVPFAVYGAAARGADGDANLDAAGNTNVGVNLDAAGNADVGANVDVAGNTDVGANVDVAGNTDVGANVDGVGNTSADANADVAGNANVEASADAKSNTEALAIETLSKDALTPTEQILAEAWRDVLDIPLPTRADDFFALGGRSLLALKVAARVRAALGRDVPLGLLFSHPTLGLLATALDARWTKPSPAARQEPALTRRGACDAPLSLPQERLWVLWRLAPESAAYNVSGALELDGLLDPVAVRRALDALVLRHEMLRTRFAERDDEPRQTILPADRAADAWAWETVDASADLSAQLRVRARAPFDLERGPLLRVTLFALAPHKHLLHFVMHHIVSDGWSINVLLREFAAGYRQAHATHHGEVSTPGYQLAHATHRDDAAVPDYPQARAFHRDDARALSALPIQYADYAAWQRERFSGSGRAELDAQLDYWRDRLAGIDAPLALPTEHERGHPYDPRAARVDIRIPADLADRLGTLAHREHATLFMVLLAAFDVLLYRYSGAQDVVVAVPVAGRDRLETEGLIGFFINTLALRAQLTGSQPFVELLRQVRTDSIDAQANSDVPFDRLVAELQLERRMGGNPLGGNPLGGNPLGGNPLAQVKFVLHDEFETALDLDGVRCTLVDTDASDTRFELALDVQRGGANGLDCVFRYAAELYDDAFAAQFARHYVDLLEQIVAAPQLAIGAYRLEESDAEETGCASSLATDALAR